MVRVAIAGVFGMDDTVTEVEDDKHGLGWTGEGKVFDSSVISGVFREFVGREDVDDIGERVWCTLGCSKKGDEAMPVGTLGLSLASIGGEEVAL